MNDEKKYNEALERARDYYKVNLKLGKADENLVLEDIFPELAEYKDEKIRKGLIKAVSRTFEGNTLFGTDVTREEALAWLEKQGEQKPIDNVESKDYSSIDPHFGKPIDKQKPQFHEGEWLCENEPNNYARFIQILEIVNVQGKNRYRISRDIHKDEDVVEFGFVEKYYHKLDIKDAKDGDILSTPIDVLIFKSYLPKNGGVSYCHYTFDCGWNQFNHNENNNWYFGKEAIIHPATKEQCDQLEKAMADAGYTFDFEKKELKEIEHNSNSYCQEHCKGFQETGKCFADGDCKAKTIAETVHAGTENILNELASRIEKAEIVNVRQVLEWIEERTKE